MWWTWYRTDELTANRLLAVREQSIRINESHSAVPEDWVIAGEEVKFLKLGDMFRKSFRSGRSQAYAAKWNESSIFLNVGYDWLYDGEPAFVSEVVIRGAEWSLIEAKAREENWTFYRQVIVTVLAVIVLGWVVFVNEFRQQRLLSSSD